MPLVTLVLQAVDSISFCTIIFVVVALMYENQFQVRPARSDIGA
ncbi:hypothetical protein [Pseudomonas sp. NPDC008258]